MAKFKYVGIEGVESPATIYHYGQRFDRGEVSEVKDETHAQKLKQQEGFEDAPDDAETLAERQVKETKEANAKAREDEKKKRDEEAKKQKYRPVDDEEEEEGKKPETGLKDQKKAKKREDRIHAKSGYSGGNIAGKDDAQPGESSEGEPADTSATPPTDPAVADWDESA
jgi:hypothetical protein